MRPRLAAALRHLLAVPPRAQALVLGVSVGLIMLVGSATTTVDLPWEQQVPAVRSTSIACTSGDTVSVSWSIDEAQDPPPVDGVTLSGLSAACAALPITVSITDGTGGILASVTTPPGATASDTLFFDFSAHRDGLGVPIPPIHGLRVDVPDPAGQPIALPVGEDVTIAATYSDGTFLAFTFPSIATPGASVTVSSGDTAQAATGGFALSDPPIYFDVSASGLTFDGSEVEVCVYVPATFSATAVEPRLFHYLDGAWVDETSSWTPATGTLCGTVTRFSPFSLGLVGYDSTTATMGSASAIALGAPIGLTTTVEGLTKAPRVAGGFFDPTGGTTFRYCFSASSADAVATCAAGTDVATATLVPGTPNDGIATATASWTPPYPGWYRILAGYAGNGVYDPSADASAGGGVLVRVGSATTTIQYTGDTYRDSGSLTLAATLSSGNPACIVGKTVTFSVTTGEGAAVVASATTASDGTATVLNYGPGPGVYDVKMAFAGDQSCNGSTNTATIVIGATGDSSNGGGWYTDNGQIVALSSATGRINYGYAVSIKKTTTKGVTTTATTGRLLWHGQGRYRIAGTVSGFTTLTSCPPDATGPVSCAAIVGTGTLSQWNGTTWVSVASGVRFTATVGDGGTSTTCTKGKSGKCTTTDQQDYFRMAIDNYSVVGETTNLVAIKGGGVVIR